jgi:hypothetical protein
LGKGEKWKCLLRHLENNDAGRCHILDFIGSTQSEEAGSKQAVSPDKTHFLKKKKLFLEGVNLLRTKILQTPNQN